MKLLLVIGVVAAALGSADAHAWGREGHRMTALIAEAELTPRARSEVKRLLGKESLADVSSWMDNFREAMKRETPGSDKWHYENRAACGTSDRAIYCANGDCVTVKAAEFIAKLSNARQPIADRAYQLKLVVHMVGDMHQPLHIVDDDDWGGNKKAIAWQAGEDAPKNLHAAWDFGFPKDVFGTQDEKQIAKHWRQRFSDLAPIWREGTVATWASEIEAVGRLVGYQRLPGYACPATPSPDPKSRTQALYDGALWGTSVREFSADYSAGAMNLVPSLLTRAGVRMGHAINVALDPAYRQKSGIKSF